MKLFKNIALITGLVISNFSFGQCYDDNCDDDNDIPVPGCCTATTAGMTWSGYGDVGCVNMGSGIPDTWISFTAPTTGFIQVTIDNITQDGVTQFVVFDHQNSEVCASLNSFGILAGSACNDLPGDGVGGVTSIDTIEYAVEAGERYWLLVSADVTNGATAGTFEACVNIIPPPPPPPPLPGQDCVTAQPLCNESGDGFTNGQLDLGDGDVEENTTGGWSSCIGNETSSQWYTFTASEAGTITMLLEPFTYSSATQSGDDFDWELYNITASGCTNTAVSLACNYSGCRGATGFSATGAAGLGQVAVTDYQANNPPGPGDCESNQQFTTANVSLVAGNTYALLIQNFTGSLGGVEVFFGGTSVLGPTTTTVEFDALLDQTDCEATLTLLNNSGIPNYTYEWDFGDGTTVVGADPGDHYYGTPGTYIVDLTVTDPLGCTESFQRIIDVADCTPIPLPIGVTNFQANKFNNEVVVSWIAETQSGVDYFVVQRSTDIDNWEDVETVIGEGTTDTQFDYSIVDRSPIYDLSYYRLKEVNFNGEVNYSPLRSVKFLDNHSLVKIVNIYGQLVSSEYRGVVYHIYSDGTSKTVIQ